MAQESLSFRHPVPAPLVEQPKGFTLDSIGFDPAVDLDLQPPKFVKNLDFKDVAFPYTCDRKNWPGLAYTQPFKVLSDAGIKKLRSAVERELPVHGKANKRIPLKIRGMGYLSQAVRDFSYCEQINNLLSELARTPIGVHPVQFNMGHTNIGQLGTGQPVDNWHIDSVDYVLVIILSDVETMKGGDLEVVQLADGRGEFERLKREGVPKELVQAHKYPNAGYGIFMHGSKILHRVTEVESGVEPRISFVNSYQNEDVMQPDLCRYATGDFGDPEEVYPYEYARHKAWRAEGKMRYIMEKEKFGADPLRLSKILESAGQELIQAAKLLSGEESELDNFIESTKSEPPTKRLKN